MHVQRWKRCLPPLSVLSRHTRVSTGPATRERRPLGVARRALGGSPASFLTSRPCPLHGARLGDGPPRCGLLRGASPQDLRLHDRASPSADTHRDPSPRKAPRHVRSPAARSPGSRRAAASRPGSPGAGGGDSEKQVPPGTDGKAVVTQGFPIEDRSGCRTEVGRRALARRTPQSLLRAPPGVAARHLRPGLLWGAGAGSTGARGSTRIVVAPDLHRRVVFLRFLLHNGGSLAGPRPRAALLFVRRKVAPEGERFAAGVKAAGQG